MKTRVKIWTAITDSGDGSSSVAIFTNEAKARENLDENGFVVHNGEIISEAPVEVDYVYLELSDILSAQME